VKASCNERSGHHRVASTTETDKHSSNCCCASTKQNKQRKKSKNATSHALPPLILEARNVAFANAIKERPYIIFDERPLRML